MARGGAERGREKRGEEADTQQQQVCESSSQWRRREKEEGRRRRNQSERNSVAAVRRDTNTERPEGEKADPAHFCPHLSVL